MSDLPPLTHGPQAWFTADHRECDAEWAAVEWAVDADEGRAPAAWTSFDRRMRRHFDMEEQVLFPAFEADTGMTGGPTAVMRFEHEQMRALLDQMDRAARAGDWREVLDQGDTLLMLVQQHNMKEEGMLYPMLQMHLGGAWAAVVPKLERYLP